MRLSNVEASLAMVGSDGTQERVSVPDAPAHAAEPTDVLSFRTFYDEHHTPIARALGIALDDTALGVEAADEAMTRAYQRWAAVRGYDNPQGWVYRVGLNWARSFLRRAKRIVLTDRVRDEGHEDRAPADPALARAVADLDPKHRDVVVARYLLDWSIDDTADALGIKKGTVKSRLHRALAQLETTLTTTSADTAEEQ